MELAVGTFYFSILFTHTLAGNSASGRGKCAIPYAPEVQCHVGEDLISALECSERCEQALHNVTGDEKIGFCRKNSCYCMWLEWDKIAEMHLERCVKLEKLKGKNRKEVEKLHKKQEKRAKKTGYQVLSRWSLDPDEPSCSHWERDSREKSE